MSARTIPLLILVMVPLMIAPGIAAPKAKAPQGKLIPLEPIFDNSYLLKGSVQHADQLPPAPAPLRTGAIFDESKLQTLTKDNSWYQIPAWFAGSWRSEEQSQYYQYDYSTGEEDHRRVKSMITSNEDIGWQKDKLGGIWQRVYHPYLTVSYGASVYFVSYVRLSIPLYVSNEKIVMRYQSVSAKVSNTTRRVVSSEQRESIQTYTPVTKYGFVKVVSSMKHFDEDGKPSILTQAVIGKSRTQMFSPWNTYKGLDIRALFKQYLIKRGLLERVP